VDQRLKDIYLKMTCETETYETQTIVVVIPGKWIVGTQHLPPLAQFFFGVVEKSTNVSPNVRNSKYVEIQQSYNIEKYILEE